VYNLLNWFKLLDEAAMNKTDLTTIQIKKAALVPLDEIAESFGVRRSVVVRWALEQYVHSFLSSGSNDLTIKRVERPSELAQVPV